MKKLLKAMLTLSLTSMVLAAHTVSYAQDSSEEIDTVEEVASEEDAEIVDTEMSEIQTSEIPEDLLSLINEANRNAESRQINGFLDFSFGEADFFASLSQIDYSISHTSTDPISAELVLGAFNPENEPTFSYFAYLHQGYILEAQEDNQWIIDDASSIEPLIVELLLENGTEGEDLKAKYLNYYESDTGYHFILKENIDASELWADLSIQYNLDVVRENIIMLLQAQSEVAGIEVNQELIDVINSMLSEEKLAEILSENSKFEMIYNKETYKLEDTVMILNINIRDIYEILGTDPNEAPSFMRIVSEMSFSQHGEEFDFSFLDEVIPQ